MTIIHRVYRPPETEVTTAVPDADVADLMRLLDLVPEEYGAVEVHPLYQVNQRGVSDFAGGFLLRFERAGKTALVLLKPRDYIDRPGTFAALLASVNDFFMLAHAKED